MYFEKSVQLAFSQTAHEPAPTGVRNSSFENQTVSLVVEICPTFISAIYQQTLQLLQREVQTHGFTQGHTPLTYIATTYKPLVTEHLKNFFYYHCAHAALHHGIAQYKIPTIGTPQLSGISINLDAPAKFTFTIPIAQTTTIKSDWKKLHFKAPGRKNYKDLDRQVEYFLQDEQKKRQTLKGTIDFNDWVCINVQVLDEHGAALCQDFCHQAWLKIGEEEVDKLVQELFLGRKAGDSFITTNDFFQQRINHAFSTRYHFQVTIAHHIPCCYFDVDRFKNYFKIKTAKELHQKLIEVFSFRHDISQRRETVEKLFKLLFYHYPLQIPPQAIVEQEKLVLSRVHNNPDYLVYKSQPDFKEKIHHLAEKQLKEMLFVDTISFQENIQATDDDIVNYLNLLKRPRTKEFIYFEIPQTKMYDQEIPLQQEELRRYCQREKTLNYIIHYLTKKN